MIGMSGGICGDECNFTLGRMFEPGEHRSRRSLMRMLPPDHGHQDHLSDRFIILTANSFDLLLPLTNVPSPGRTTPSPRLI